MNNLLINDAENRIKRLIFRSNHRGWKETDLVMGAFARRELVHLTLAELNAYEALLDENDADIWDWLVGKEPPTRPDYACLIEKMREYRPEV